MGQQEIVRLVEGRDVRMAGERDEPGAGDLLGRPLGLGVHFVRVARADETRHPPCGQIFRDAPLERGGSPGRLERGGIVLLHVHVRSGSGKR